MAKRCEARWDMSRRPNRACMCSRSMRYEPASCLPNPAWRLTTRSVRTSTEMNDWFADEWTGIAQSFQVMRTVKGKRRKVIEQAEAGEQTRASEPEQPNQQQTQTTPPPKAKPSKKSKQVTF